MPETLLRTKLFIPLLRPNLVPRRRLIERLNQGLQLEHKLTLISAPAGFGKTTLVSEWVTGCRQPAAWLSLDDGDNNPIRFLTYLVAALQTTEANIGEGALSLLQSPQPPPTETVLTSLINDITALSTKTILVLDDCHVIVSTAVDNALTFLLENLPPQIHLVIATREDPNLPLARLRVRGQLTELRAADLRFSISEVAEFLNRVMGLDLSAEEIAALDIRTEGWIASLQLAAISMQGRADTTSFIHAFTGTHYFVLDYLVEEVLQRQPEDVRIFLLQTSILDRLSGSLCDAVTGRGDSREMLEALERGNLFVVPLDDNRQWYRYHHLFADVLQTHLMQQSPKQADALHLRASNWYADNGSPSDAIRHALAAEDFEQAAGLIELAWPAMNENDQLTTWYDWIQALPDELVRTRPVLSVGYAFALLHRGELEAAEARLRDTERWLQAETGLNGGLRKPPPEMVIVDDAQFRSLPVTLAAARAYHAQAVGDGSSAVTYGQRVLDLLSEGDHPWRASFSALLGLVNWADGDLESANQYFSDALAAMNPPDVITSTFVHAEIKMVLGQLRGAESIFEHALQLALEQGEPMPVGTEDLYSGFSALHRERGDLEAAAQDLQTSKKLGEQTILPDWQHRWCIAQARLKQSQGDLDGALDLLDKARRLYVRTPIPIVRPIAALKTRIWVAQGRLAEARSWAHDNDLSVNDDLSYLREFEHITLTRVLIAQFMSDHDDGAIHAASGLLERLLQAAEEGGRMGTAIEILVLLALANNAQGDSVSALVSLDRALTLAEPEGYVQIFVDDGPPMAVLLQEAAIQGVAQNYVRQLLTFFVMAEGRRPVTQSLITQQAFAIEPLSDRELEVLQCIAEGLTNRDIAERLYLSLNTVKVHTRNINGKLGVHSRTQAVAKGRAMGILPLN